MGSTHSLKPIHLFSLSLSELEGIFQASSAGPEWNCPFVLPFWLKNWWQVFGPGKEPIILAARADDAIVGIAPLMREARVATFMGSEALCDYQDMALADDCAEGFFIALLKNLKDQGVDRLVLGALRPDSNIIRGLPEAAKTLGVAIRRETAGRVYELKLPGTWEGYLKLLDGKQRHEIRRKIRRMQEAGKIGYQVTDSMDLLDDALEAFFFLFEASRDDKAQFLTGEMKSFFRVQARSMLKLGMLKLGVLSVNNTAVGATMGFSYQKRLYLYNNGYHPRFSALSPGTMAKVMSIRHGISEHMGWYDFLKGDEDYKQRLGGRPVTLYRLIIDL